MEIIWHGQSAFNIKGAKATVALDPVNGDAKADIVMESEQEKESKIKDARILNLPGEFEVSGISIESIPSAVPGAKPINIFAFTIDGIRICSMGTLSDDLSEATFESIGDVDILLIPVGSKGVLSAKQAQIIVEEIDPRIVIPSCHEGAPSEFLKIMGKTDLRPLDKFSAKSKSELPGEKTEFVLLNIV